MKGRTPTVFEKRFLDAIAGLGCVVCIKYLGVETPAAVHHMDGKTKPYAHIKVLPLCKHHHQIKSNKGLWVSRHGDGRAAFEAEYGTEVELWLFCLERLALFCDSLIEDGSFIEGEFTVLENQLLGLEPSAH